MSDDTRYPCCEHVHRGHNKSSHPIPANWRWLPCAVAGCAGSAPVGPTKEGKQ